MNTQLDPIWDECDQLPDGECTLDWAIKNAGELMAKNYKEYEGICVKYLTGNAALFKNWPADYKNNLVNHEILFMHFQSNVTYRQYGITPDEKKSEIDGALKYLEKCRTIYALRKPYKEG